MVEPVENIMGGGEVANVEEEEDARSYTSSERREIQDEFLEYCDTKDILKGLFLMLLKSETPEWNKLSQEQTNQITHTLIQDVDELKIEFSAISEKIPKGTENYQEMASAIRLYSELRVFTFDVHDRDINDDQVKIILDAVSNLPYLEHFDLNLSYKDTLTEKTINSIVDFLWRRESPLKVLNLDLSGFDALDPTNTEVWVNLADVLTNFPSLIELRLTLGQNIIPPKIIEYFVDIILGLRNLSILELDFETGLKLEEEQKKPDIEILKTLNLTERIAFSFPRGLQTEIKTDYNDPIQRDISELVFKNRDQALDAYDIHRAVREEVFDQREVLFREEMIPEVVKYLI